MHGDRPEKPDSLRDLLNRSLADRFLIGRELGRGGMASVWLARDVRHQRDVAVKVMHQELAAAIGVDRFIREIRLTAGLQHPNIVPVLDSGTIAGPNGTQLPWYAMAYVSGESLADRLRRERQLPVDEALRITTEIAAALEAAHQKGIVHRDVKPENVLLSQSRVYVGDFGIAKAVIETGGERLTSTGWVIGTPAYMSPEQATAERVDARSDQYGLASVLYEMLAGEPPFTGPTAQSIVARQLAEPARPVRSVRPAVPRGVEAAVLRALERIPADRFPTVSAFVDALRREADIPRRGPLPRRLLWTAGAVGVIGALAIISWQASPRRRPGVARDSVAVALYRQGLAGYSKRTPLGISEAIESFKAAIQRDSTYAEAWAGLGNSYVRAFERRFVFPGGVRDSILGLAAAAADKALAFDQRNVDAWVTRAIVSRSLDPTDLAPAFSALQRAFAIDSTNPQAWHTLAISHAESDHMDQAVEAWHRAVREDPAYTQGLAFLSLGFYWRRQYDSAAVWADSAVLVNPNFVLGRTAVGLTAIERGQTSRARAAFDAQRRLSTDVEVVNALALSAMTEARAGNTVAAQRLLQRAESLATAFTPAPLHTAVFMAQPNAVLGNHRRAMAWLHRYTPREDLHYQLHLRCDPPFDPLARTPAFQALLLESQPRPNGGC